MIMPLSHCKICSGSSFVKVGVKRGRFEPRDFQIYSCNSCGFVFVANPWTEFDKIYSEEYYRGEGADPIVDYSFELANPHLTVRQYEWRGIFNVVQSLRQISKGTRWLDFGAGNGGLVRYVRERAGCEIFGYDHGWISSRAIEAGIPFLSDSELEQSRGSFDIVTAIEVIEHVFNPLDELRRIRSLLKPGGVFFYTTGNAARHRRHLLRWKYMIPEVHMSFYEPQTLATAFRAVGLRPEFRGFVNGFSDIIRYKVLRALGLRRPAAWEKLLPWPVLSRIVNSRFGVSEHPIGWAE